MQNVQAYWQGVCERCFLCLRRDQREPKDLCGKEDRHFPKKWVSMEFINCLNLKNRALNTGYFKD